MMSYQKVKELASRAIGWGILFNLIHHLYAMFTK
jgi:hypothetical protein